VTEWYFRVTGHSFFWFYSLPSDNLLMVFSGYMLNFQWYFPDFIRCRVEIKDCWH
jgi:hypothetical protein